MAEAVAIVGAGLMGHALAADFARHGFAVAITDSNEALLGSVRDRVRGTLRVLERASLLHAETSEQLAERIAVANTLDEAVRDAAFVLEAVDERLSTKRGVFARLDVACGPAVTLASNTSGLSATALAEGLGHPERVIVAHHFNPPHLVPAVEVVPSPRTSPAVVQSTMDVLRRAGKTPVLLKREVPGFVANRLQAALLREAIALVAGEVIEASDLDALVKTSLGRRLDVLGPFEVLDFAGVDVWDDIMSYLAPDLARGTEPPRLLRELVRAGHLGVKSGHGVYDWPPPAIERAQKARDEELLRQIAGESPAG